MTRAAKDDPSTRSRTSARTLVFAWLHLAVLWTFAFAQPLFEILSDSPEFFVARGNTTGDILLFAIGVTLLPPTILVAIEAVFTRLPHVRSALHLVFVAVLAAALVLQLLDDAVGRVDGPSDPGRGDCRGSGSRPPTRAPALSLSCSRS